MLAWMRFLTWPSLCLPSALPLSRVKHHLHCTCTPRHTAMDLGICNDLNLARASLAAQLL